MRFLNHDLLRLILPILLFVISLSNAFAVQPDEILSDPVLEERARDISSGLRCLVCQNESIDESNADLAKTFRILVRERLVAGDSDEEVISYLVDRYGEFILLKPVFGIHTLLLWFSGPLILIFGGFLAWQIFMSSRKKQLDQTEKNAALNEEEEEMLKKILESD